MARTATYTSPEAMVYGKPRFQEAARSAYTSLTPRTLSWKLRFAIADQTGVPIEEVRASTFLASDLGLDPFDLLELVDALEAKLGICIPDDKIAGLTTKADIERFRLAGPGAST
jgi:acyl carrier protein